MSGWTHETVAGGYESDPFAHPWKATAAWQLLNASLPSPDGRRRYATANGIAFEAKPTGDGTWHGYPIPWEAVPHDVVQKWIAGGAVTRRQTRKSFNMGNIHWAIEAGLR